MYSAAPSAQSCIARDPSEADTGRARGRGPRTRSCAGATRRSRADHLEAEVLDPGGHVADPFHLGAVRPAVTSSSTTIPSWDSTGQQAAVWLDSRLPSPNTTGFSLTFRIGWTVHMLADHGGHIGAGEGAGQASRSLLGACTYSSPQWRQN